MSKFGTKDNHLEQLYFIAIVPPADIQDEITDIKLEVAKKYHSRHALNSPPHITLHMPFKWKDKRLEELKKLMHTLNERLTPFQIQLENFDFFEPRVLFIDVVRNEKLFRLQSQVIDQCRKQLNLTNANYKNRPFHPHVTVAFRDLKKPMFYEARKEFEQKKYECAFSVSKIALLQHNGKVWRIYQEVNPAN